MDDAPGDRVAANNLAVCHVYAGKISIATRVCPDYPDTGPSLSL